MTKRMLKHLSKQKAIDHALWLNFQERVSKIEHGVIPSFQGGYIVTPIDHPTFKGEVFEDLPADYTDMNYNDIKYIKADDDPLPHWETIFGMLSTTNGEILRYILAYNIPLEKLIRYELAMRGYDQNHQWVGFEEAEEIWLK